MKNIPVISGELFAYARMKGISWQSSLGTLPSVVQAAAVASLEAALLQAQSDGKDLVVNCRGISSIDDHAFESLADTIGGIRNSLIFTNTSNVHDRLHQELRSRETAYPGGIMVYGRHLAGC